MSHAQNSSTLEEQTSRSTNAFPQMAQTVMTSAFGSIGAVKNRMNSQQSKRSKHSSSSHGSRYQIGATNSMNQNRMGIRGMSGTTGGFPYQVKTTTESTDSKRTNSEVSEKHYMRHTSSSKERAKTRAFGKSPKNMLRQGPVGYGMPNFMGTNLNKSYNHNGRQYFENIPGAMT